MLTIVAVEVSWWLGLYLLSCGSPNVPRVLIASLLGFDAVGQALTSINRLDLSPQPIGLGITIVLIGAGLWVVRRDASRRNENSWLPFLRSLDGAVLTSVVFGVQAIVFTSARSVTASGSVVLLYSLPATAILIQTFSSRFQALFDRMAFSYLPRLTKERLTQARDDLREAAEILPRTSTDIIDLAALPEAEFNQLVRRALSNFGDLPRLAISPLIYLPVIDQRLAGPGRRADTLERAVVLKQLLAKAIQRLKPSDGTSGTSPEWRYFNVLYFPYVLGFKPYSLRFTDSDHLNADHQKMLAWFRANVPERTLYNWQNAAARLVALNLRSLSPP